MRVTAGRGIGYYVLDMASYFELYGTTPSMLRTVKRGCHRYSATLSSHYHACTVYVTAAHHFIFLAATRAWLLATVPAAG